MTRFAQWASAALLLGFSWNVAQAAQSAAAESPGEALTLRQALVLALQRNPDLKSFSFVLRAQDARIDAAGLKPAPVVSAEVENVLGTGAASGLDAAEATFSLSQVIELGGKRSHRIALAQSGREQMDVERAAAQLDVVAEVGRRFIAVARAQRELEWSGRAVDLARDTVEAARRRVEAARSPEVELARARVDLTRAELGQREATQSLQALRRKLAAMWGAPDATFGTVSADLFALPRPAQFEALMQRLAATPDFMRFASEVRLRDAAVRLAEVQRRPDVQWSAGIRRLQASRDQGLVVGFSVPLFASRQAEPGIAEARALRGQVDAQREAAFVKARAQLYELYQALLYAIEETTVLGRDVLPQMQQVLEDTEYAYERGRYGYVELIEAQRATLAAERAQIDAAARAQELQNEMERLAGEPLAPELWESTQP